MKKEKNRLGAKPVDTKTLRGNCSRCESFRHAYRHKGATHLVELSYPGQPKRTKKKRVFQALETPTAVHPVTCHIVSRALLLFLSVSLWAEETPLRLLASAKSRLERHCIGRRRRHIVARIIQPPWVYDFLFCHWDEAKPLLFSYRKKKKKLSR